MTKKPDTVRTSHKKNGDKNLVRVQLAEPMSELHRRLVTGDIIGQGGTGKIEKAFDANLLRYVAKKKLLEDDDDFSYRRGRLIEEAQITSQLGHPNIVPVHELGVDDDNNLFFTMKLVQGRTFGSILDSTDCANRTKKDLYFYLQILTKVCDALAFAHSRGVVHRDLKPDNIMVGEFGEVYLMDWGLAKLQKGWRPSKRDTVMPVSLMPQLGDRELYEAMDEDGLLRGTIYYMSPEQARGDFNGIDERTDVFLLGGILYKILTQRAPYHGDNIYQLIYQAQQADIQPPEVVSEFDTPAKLSDIAMKALEKEPEKRYQSVTDFKNDVEEFLQSGWQFERRIFPAGTVIVQEGDIGDTAYVITKGCCEVYRTIDGVKHPIAEIKKGDVFGEVAVFTQEPRSATVAALDYVTALEIKRDYFEADLGMSFWLGLFTKALAERFLEKNEQVIKLEQEIALLRREDRS